MSHQRYFIVREVVLGTSSVRMHDNGMTLLNMDTAGMSATRGNCGTDSPSKQAWFGREIKR